MGAIYWLFFANVDETARANSIKRGAKDLL
jgi:hypothetical protein